MSRCEYRFSDGLAGGGDRKIVVACRTSIVRDVFAARPAGENVAQLQGPIAPRGW